jgi:hypothetical protein
MSGLFDATLPQSLYPALVNVFPMTMRNKSSQGGNTSAGQTADGYGTTKNVNVRRRPATEDELVRSNLIGVDNVITFSVLNDGTDSDFERPYPEARITDEAGVQWTVKRVEVKVLDTLFSCISVQGW